MNDLIIRQATFPDGTKADIGLKEGRIAEIGRNLKGRSKGEVDASELHVVPGFIDAHVHFNEPGRADWEGLETGSTALAAGGGTTFFDMPLNSDPPVLDAARLLEKRRIAEQKSLVDFALWGGLCPGHVDKIDEMAEAGAIGFKAFLCPSGIDEFPATDAATLREGLLRARQWDLPVSVHAESPEVLDRTATRISDQSFRSFLDSRPKEAEVAAIRMACEIAGETEGALHIVHISCAEGLGEVEKAKKQGVNVTAEVCAHHLLFNDDAALAIGARAKCAPPLRPARDVKALWKGLLAGEVDTIGSDHSPAPLDMKTGDDFFEIWGGIAGCQHAWPAFLGAVQVLDSDALARAVTLGSTHVAKRFRLEGKNGLAVGNDADLALVEFETCSLVNPTDLHYRHKISLYEGFSPDCRILHVFRRGEIIVAGGEVVPTNSRGRFLRPSAVRP